MDRSGHAGRSQGIDDLLLQRHDGCGVDRALDAQSFELFDDAVANLSSC